MNIFKTPQPTVKPQSSYRVVEMNDGKWCAQVWSTVLANGPRWNFVGKIGHPSLWWYRMDSGETDFNTKEEAIAALEEYKEYRKKIEATETIKTVIEL